MIDISPNRRQAIPGQVTMAIAGGSGSGKSTIAVAIAEGLQPLRVEVVGLDRFFKERADLPRYFSKQDNEYHADYNRPDSLRVDDMVVACSKPTEADVVIFDGHMALCYPRMRRLFDVSCFVEVEIEGMLVRRTERNLGANYGGDRETILHYNRECVVPGYERYILPSKKHADIVIPNTCSSLAARDEMIATLCQGIRRDRTKR